MKLRDILYIGIWLIATIAMVFVHLFPDSFDAIFKVFIGIEVVFVVYIFLCVFICEKKGDK